MEFCRNRCCPFEDCEQHPRRAPRGFAYTVKAMDENCDRYKEYLAREKEKQQRIQEVTFGKAYHIFSDNENPEVSDEEKGAAILKIINMETHNSVTKASMLKVIRWLLELSFEVPDGKFPEK